MKIKKSSIGIFFISFIIGCAAVLFFVEDRIILTNNREKTLLPRIETPANIEDLSTRKETPFVPEILGLKDFSDDFASPKYKFKLVDVAEHGNSYRKEEVIARNGETWLGLFSINGESYLKNTKLKIDYEIDPDYEGAVIKFKAEQPLFLLKNAKNLKEGKILTLFREKSSETVDVLDNPNTMYSKFLREFQIGERKYTLRIKDALTKSGEKVLALVLENGNVSQILTYTPYFDGEYLGNLLWVGDLDGDDKLDLYLVFNSYEKGSFRSSLFLSSEAERGKLVKEAAGFGTLGC